MEVEGIVSKSYRRHSGALAAVAVLSGITVTVLLVITSLGRVIWRFQTSGIELGGSAEGS